MYQTPVRNRVSELVRRWVECNPPSWRQQTGSHDHHKYAKNCYPTARTDSTPSLGHPVHLPTSPAPRTTATLSSVPSGRSHEAAAASRRPSTLFTRVGETSGRLHRALPQHRLSQLGRHRQAPQSSRGSELHSGGVNLRPRGTRTYVVRVCREPLFTT